MDDNIYKNDNSFGTDGFNPPGNYENQFAVTFDERTLRKAAGWITFWCIIQIIGGISACLTIIGIPMGIFNLMGSFKLLSVGEKLKSIASSGNAQTAKQALEDLHPVFKNFGIAIIVSVLFTALAYVAVVAVVILLVQSGTDILNEYGNFYF